MNIVLLSGGSGKRLWPLSNDTLSKQFLKLIKDDSGRYESMVQRVVRQLTTVYKDAHIFVSCNTSQDDILKSQLGTFVETILEPTRRNTFPAIVLAAAYLRYKKQLGENDVFIVCPIDVFADKEYFELLADVKGFVDDGMCRIGLMGAFPTYPTVKYGYIKQSDGVVTGFVEKPPEKEAEQLIAQGALWNCGVFALKISQALEHARAYVAFDSFESLHAQYEKLPKISFDYQVVEKEPEINVAVYKGKWKDLGTWATLTSEMQDDTLGNAIVSEQCNNTHALNMLNIPMIVHDIKDAVVVAGYDGIIVSSKAGSSLLKDLTDPIEQRPMYEQHSWGEYRVLDSKHSDEVSSLIKRLRIHAGHAVPFEYHENYSAVWVIVSGVGVLTIDGIDSNVIPGFMSRIPKQAKISITASTELEIVEIQL